MKKINLRKCPKCGGVADNGFDRCDPPSVYYCSKCMKTTKTQKTKKVSKLAAWAVGHDGQFDWDVMRAKDEMSAKLAWIEDHSYGHSPEFVSATRMETWDGKDVTKRMWFKHFGAHCDVCSYETFRESGGIIDRKGNVVCEECQHERKIMKIREKKNAKYA